MRFALRSSKVSYKFGLYDGAGDLGWSGERAPGFAGRLENDLAGFKPTVTTLCYGMNDGIYYPYGEDRAEAFRSGIRRLREKAAAAGARVIHLTPPTFDPTPLKGRTLPAGRAEYRSPYEGYNDVLDRYAAWLVEQRKQGWEVIDIHAPMNAYLQQRRQSDPQFLLAGDVFSMDQIESYIELKWSEVYRFEHTPHPVEFEMYYSV